MKFVTTSEYNDYLLEKMVRYNLEKYFIAYHKQFCPDQDISFVPYFLELCGHEHEFYVPHTKLIEFGIMSNSMSSNDVKRRLDKCEQKEGIDYKLRKVSQPVAQGGIVTKNVYMLKPLTFKTLLVQAGTNSKQAIDVKRYLKYYFLLEQVYKYYNEYDRKYLNKLLSMKDEKIDKLSEDMESQSKQLNEQIIDLKTIATTQSKELTAQSEQLNQLMEYTKDIKSELADIKILLKEILGIVHNISYLPNVFKRFYDKDHGDKKIKGNERFSLTSIGKTKILVFVGTLIEEENTFKIECVNRKLNEPIVQVNKILNRAEDYNHNKVFETYYEIYEESSDESEDEEDEEQPVNKKKSLSVRAAYTNEVKQELEGKFHKVLMPQAYGISTINEQEVRSTFSTLTRRSPQFKDIENIKKVYWNTKYKALMIEGISSVENAQLCFDTFINENQIASMNSYDQALEQSIKDSKEDVAVEVLDELKRRNNGFICKSKERLDEFYQKTFILDVRTPTLLRIKSKPLTTVEELKINVRELVVIGIDYE